MFVDQFPEGSDTEGVAGCSTCASYTREQGDELPPGANIGGAGLCAQAAGARSGATKWPSPRQTKGISSGRILFRARTCPTCRWHTDRHSSQPVGVPSRMNVGQVFECLMGWASHLGCRVKWCPSDGLHGKTETSQRNTVKVSEGGGTAQPARTGSTTPITPARSSWWMGRTGETFDQPVTVWLCPHPSNSFTCRGRQDSTPRSTGSLLASFTSSSRWAARSQQGGQRARGRWRSGFGRPPQRRCLHPAGTAHRQIRTNCSGRNEGTQRHRQGQGQISPSRHAGVVSMC